MEYLLIAAVAFFGGFFLHRWIVGGSVSPEQLQDALEKQKESLRTSIKNMIQKSQDEPQFATRFETVMEEVFVQMTTVPMEVVNPEAYDALLYLLKYRLGDEDLIDDRTELRATAQRGVKQEVHYLSIRPH